MLTAAEQLAKEMEEVLRNAWHFPDGRKRRVPVWPGKPQQEGLSSDYLNTGVTATRGSKSFGYGSTAEGPREVNL